MNHPGYQYTMVEGKIVVSGISRLRLKIRYPANNNFAKCQGISANTEGATNLCPISRLFSFVRFSLPKLLIAITIEYDY